MADRSTQGGSLASRVARPVGVIALVLAVSALLLECTARVVLFGAAGLHPLRVDSVRPILEEDLMVSSSDPDIGFELRPDLDTWFKLARFRTNSRGLRDEEVDPAKPDGSFRVAVMGSSFTMPAGVALEDAFHTRIERRLDAEGRPAQLVNFAVGAYHPAQSLAVLEARARGYGPDLVLFCLTEMAIAPALGTLPPRLPLIGPRSHPFFHSFLYDLVRVRRGEVLLPDVRHAPGPIPTTPVPSVVERLGGFQERTGIPVVLVRLEFEDAEPSAEDARLLRNAERHGLRLVDTRAAFRGLDPRSLWIYELDPHPDAAAHAIFADVVGAYLEGEGLLPESGADRVRTPPRPARIPDG